MAVLVCSLAPMLVWPLSGHHLTHPWQGVAWGLVCAALAAVTPARYLRLTLVLQTLAFPLTVGWIGVIAVTGYGPSSAEFEAATSGSSHEVWMATQLACTQIAFIVTVAFTFWTLAWAWWANWRVFQPTRVAIELIYLAAMVPLGCASMDAVGYPGLATIADPEVRLSVPWLAHLGMAKSLLAQTIDRVTRGPTDTKLMRSALSAEKLFEMSPGLAVFVVGESLRADALMQKGRGPWSSKLQHRFDSGLGVRLKDACAGANSTHASVPLLLTAAAPGDAAAPKSTILATAKMAGAKTAYINNQGTWIVPETGHDVMQAITTTGHQSYDDAVIEALRDFVVRTGYGPKAALLHLYGQHFFYDQRYPPTAFAPIPENLNADEREERQYAQAAEYGLKVLLDAANILDQQRQPSFLIFTSDHGENLVSDRTGKKYHALPISGKNDTTVPAIALWNQAFADSGRARLLNALIEGDGLIAHRDVALAWLALAGAPGNVIASPEPKTWGALVAGAGASAISCSALAP
jgi:glucan phosphoethanolaminetransferase (alkaline phosphatase superfamily)